MVPLMFSSVEMHERDRPLLRTGFVFISSASAGFPESLLDRESNMFFKILIKC